MRRLARLGHIFALQTRGRLERVVKTVRIWLALSPAPHRQPRSIHRPDGRPRLALRFLLHPSRWFTWSETAGRFGYFVKCAHLVPSHRSPKRIASTTPARSRLTLKR